MKTFLVELKIQAGEYEKSCLKLENAETKEEAGKMAILGECHGEPEWTDTGAADLGWEFHYSVYNCKEVLPEHVSILESYFNPF